jgi:hypothetical protein
MSLLKPVYHLDHDLLTRLIRTIWTKTTTEDGKCFINCGPATGNGLLLGKEGGQLMDYPQWEQFLRDEGLYVPIF